MCGHTSRGTGIERLQGLRAAALGADTMVPSETTKHEARRHKEQSLTPPRAAGPRRQ